MHNSDQADANIKNKSFLLVLLLVTLAFTVMLLPFYGALFWAAVLAIIFQPIQRMLIRRHHRHQNLTALLTLLICLFLAIIPVVLISISLVNEGQLLYQKVQSGNVNVGAYLDKVRGLIPTGLRPLIERYGLENNLDLKSKITEALMQSSQFIANQALSIGQNAFKFILSIGLMLYLLFFFIRDGVTILERIRQALPLEETKKSRLFGMFATVVRATIKGNLIVAATQGLLGGIIFSILGIEAAVLWGVLMAFLSLVPAVGSGLIWLPTSLYLLLSGEIWRGIVLILFGLFVIGLVDNLLRPILVGKDIKLPDYLVLLSTIGGIVLVGMNGFVIGPLIAALFVSCWSLLQDDALG